MTKRIASLALLMSALVTPALAGPSGQHSTNASHHSGQASIEGSAAVSTGTAIIASVPIMAVGSALAISGAGLQIVGEDVLLLGVELHSADTGHRVATQDVAPNAPPTLD